MSATTFTDLRQHLASYFDQVTESRDPLVVTCLGGKGNVVILREEEFAGWQETVHLLSSPKNAAYFAESIAQARAEKMQEHALLVPGAVVA